MKVDELMNQQLANAKLQSQVLDKELAAAIKRDNFYEQELKRAKVTLRTERNKEKKSRLELEQLGSAPDPDSEEHIDD